MRKTRRRTVLAVLASAAVAGAAGAAWLRPAACFLADARGEPPFFCSAAPFTRAMVEVPEAGFTAEVYRPAHAARATLVLVPGMHPLGITDERFRGFAEACAAAGFVVVAPDVVEFRTFRIEPTVVDRLARLVVALPRHVPAGAVENTGLFGISYAGGPVLMAAARPDVARALRFVGAFGGYYDLAHAVDFAVTGAHPPARELPPPHQWARMVFVAQDAESFLPGPEAQVLREALLLRLTLRLEEAHAREGTLSAGGQALLKAVLDGPAPGDAERFRRVVPRYAALSRQLSPAEVLPTLDPRLQVYLLHGFGDDIIPYYETAEMEQALRASRHPHVQALVTRVFRHVDPGERRAGGPAAWREQLRLLRWTRAFVGEARG
jgi:dienelactone hydrolase